MLKILDYHSGQNDPLYAVGSSWYAGHSVPRSLVKDMGYNLMLDSSPGSDTTDPDGEYKLGLELMSMLPSDEDIEGAIVQQENRIENPN